MSIDIRASLWVRPGGLVGSASMNTDGRLTRSLREAIDASGLPLAELQKRTGLDRSQLSRFMRGERSLTLTSVDRLADELGLRLVYRVKRS